MRLSRHGLIWHFRLFIIKNYLQALPKIAKEAFFWKNCRQLLYTRGYAFSGREIAHARKNVNLFLCWIKSELIARGVKVKGGRVKLTNLFVTKNNKLLRFWQKKRKKHAFFSLEILGKSCSEYKKSKWSQLTKKIQDNMKFL